jgi:hypothetical protein
LIMAGAMRSLNTGRLKEAMSRMLSSGLGDEGTEEDSVHEVHDGGSNGGCC